MTPEPGSPVPADEPLEASSPSRVGVLFVDDEDNFRESVADRMTLRGLDVRTAASGEECLEVMDEDPADVVVMDVKMSGMTGIQAMESLRAAHPDSEVVLLTGYASVGDGVRGMKAGAFDYLAKPVDIEHLVRKVRQAQDAVDRRRERRREAEFRRRMRERMAQTQRLASIGTLAAGVAHEINNPLAIINDAAGLLRLLAGKLGTDDPPPPEKFDKGLATIEKSVARAKAITHQLLGYAGGKESSPSPADVAPLVREVIDFARKQARDKDAAVNLDAPEDLVRVATDPFQLRQVLVNLVTNAIQALDRGGEVNVVLANSGDGVDINVRDDGHGMAPDVLEHIFDPFYSTKAPGQGTGLGLFVTRGLVDKLGGTMEVASAPGRGTTFTVHLPTAYKGLDGQHNRSA